MMMSGEPSDSLIFPILSLILKQCNFIFNCSKKKEKNKQIITIFLLQFGIYYATILAMPQTFVFGNKD